MTARDGPVAPSVPAPDLHLEEISTRWSVVNDPVQFAMRYAPAIRKYLGAIIRQSDDADEAAQDFLVRILEHRCVPQLREGRFRHYLKQAVRNAARAWFRRRQADRHDEMDLSLLADSDDPPSEADEQWISQWRQCVMDRAWIALEAHQHCSPGNLFYTVLQLLAQDPDADQAALAAQTRDRDGQPLRIDAFRKQVSRARRMFAELLLNEVAETLARPTPQDIEEELIDLGLLPFVRNFLPPDWRTSGVLRDA